MERIIQVKLREAGGVSYYKLGEISPSLGEYVIVEADRGVEYGQVISEFKVVQDTKPYEPLKKILRIANQDDLQKIEVNKKKSKEVFDTCFKKIEEHKLEMKLVRTEYSFDCSKIIFYFTAEGRVDFRNLVKDLAKIFKARIELRQIGVRDEARLLGGFGHCGRQLCCVSFLKNFEPVTIKIAKEQGLPLNPPKISGLCGRLMCCLSYEHHVYKELSKGLPREGERINIPEGKGKVINVNSLKRSVIIETEDGRQIEINYK